MHGMHVSPKCAKTTGPQGAGSRNPHENDPALLFYTSYAKLSVDSQQVETESLDSQPDSCEVYTLRSPSNNQIEISRIRLNRVWRKYQPEALELDFIVIRVTPSLNFEPWAHSLETPQPSSSVPPNDWTVYLMCITWIDEDVVGGSPRRAERFTYCSQEGLSVEKWMSMEPKPVEVLVELV